MDNYRKQLEKEYRDAELILNNELVQTFFIDQKELCYNNIENWDGKDVQILVHNALRCQMLRDFKFSFEQALEVGKVLTNKEEGN